MKKAKRLLAVLLAAVMLFSAAGVSTYAYVESSDNYHNPIEGSNGKYLFSYEQGASYLCDLLDGLLADANIYMTIDEIDDMAGVSVSTLLAINNLPNDALDLTSIDGLILSIWGLFEDLDEAFLGWLVTKLLGDLIDGGLNRDGLNPGVLRTNGVSTDKEVLEMVILWISNQANILKKVLAGTCDYGLLGDALIPDMIKDLPGTIRLLLYNLLIDDSADAIPADTDLDKSLQQMINWLLIDGTGTTAETGALSMLGEKAEPLMPGMKDLPGEANITAVDIMSDWDLDGTEEAHKMNVYQFVANLLDALLNSMLGPMLTDLLLGIADIEPTEEYPLGDPALMNDAMFATVTGAVESLLTQNGAPDPTYSDDGTKYPIAKVNELVNWLLNGGGLDTFLQINYQGIKLTDNFMSLLGDLARLAINLLPGLGLFASSANLAYTADELNVVKYYNSNFEYVDKDAEDVVGQTYITYETRKPIYPTAFVTEGDSTVPSAYAYFVENDPTKAEAVNTTNSNGSDYVNPDLIRPNYSITTEQVYACLVKMALNDMIDGCYFPEWTQDIPSVLAYGFAAIAAPVVPENNYYARLNAYHDQLVAGVPVTVTDNNGNEIVPLAYTEPKIIPIKDMNGTVIENREVTIPRAALDIICSFAAERLNGVFQLSKYFQTDTNLEKFACEFLAWGFYHYMPILTGELVNGKMTNTLGGAFYVEMNTFIDAVYSNFTEREFKSTANTDAIYNLIDDTLLALLPSSWLPNINGSAQLINEWLLQNLINFDLQGILSLLSVNMDSSAELNQPLLTVLLRVIDRVLALVFNDEALLIPARTGVNKNSNNSAYFTSVTTIEGLLDASSESASLPMLVYNLLKKLNTYKRPLLKTALPLIVGLVYERPYETSYLGSDMSKMKISDLEAYVQSFETNINATAIRSDLGEEDAYAAVDGGAVAVKNEDGSTYDVKLSNETNYGNYASLEAANNVINQLKNSYVYAKLIDEETETYEYTIYARDSYLDSAKWDDTEDPNNDDVYKTYHTYDHAVLTGRTTSNPQVSYNDVYRYFEFEDFGKAGYVYVNATDALDDANEFISSYSTLPESELPSAYGDWMAYSIEARLKAEGLYDSNDDGQYIDDSNYVDDATTPRDGTPGLPSSMYPFSAPTSTTNYTYLDDQTGENVTVMMGEVTAAKFEQLAMAVEYGADERNDVELTTIEKENLVRLALKSLAFDITLKENEDGTFSYNANSKQWETLSESDITAITTFCNDNGYKFVIETLEDGTTNYSIKRSAFKLLDSNYQISTGISATPPAALSGLRDNDANKTDAQKAQDEVYNCYITFISTLYANRRSLYNMYDNISYRHEQAENSRAAVTHSDDEPNLAMLKWVLEYTADAYKDPESGRRNLAYALNEDGSYKINETTGKRETVKVYTSTSYARFKDAYDFGNSLEDAVAAGTLNAGATQAMVTEAYIGILETWQQLLPFTGFADWVQLDALMAIAKDILTDENRTDDILGYEETSLEKLDTAYKDALSIRYDETYDSEKQPEINVVAAALNQAIKLLKYNTYTSVLPTEKGKTEGVRVMVEDEEATIINAQIIGLKEGQGINDDFDIAGYIQLVGMRDDVEGYTYDRYKATRGYGTNSYYAAFYQDRYMQFIAYAVLYGDLNGDTRIDGSDAAALEIYRINNGNDQLALKEDMTGAIYEAGDVNHDGVVDVKDTDAIIDHYTFVTNEETGNRLLIEQGTHSTDPAA